MGADSPANKYIVAMEKSIFDFTAKSLSGKEVDMSTYADHVILIVNTASACGFTPQYEGLQHLYDLYKSQKFVVLGFPCNQFGGQEPGDADQIKNDCLVNYGVTFPMFAKIDVNGINAHPLFTWLKNEKSGLLGKRIKWNFTKFLIDRTGNVVDRYGSMTTPAQIESAIQKLL